MGNDANVSKRDGFRSRGGFIIACILVIVLLLIVIIRCGCLQMRMVLLLCC